MYIRKATRRRLLNLSLVLVAVVLFVPKFEVPEFPRLTTLFGVAQSEPATADRAG